MFLKTTTLKAIALTGLLTSFTVCAQVGIGTVTPKTTLQVISDAVTTTAADGIQVPTLSLAQLDAKVAAYGVDQDGAIVYIDDVSVASTKTETIFITGKGVYFYEATADLWYKLNNSGCGLSIGDSYSGGIIFYLDASGCHGLVSSKPEHEGNIRWHAGSYEDTQAKGDGLYAGKANTSIIIAVHASLGGDNQTYAARICNELQVLEDGISYGDWYLPSLYELNLMYENIGPGDSLGLGNIGVFINNFYWSSTEDSSINPWCLKFSDGVEFNNLNKVNAFAVRAVRAF